MSIFKRKPKTTDTLQNMMAKLKVFADELGRDFFELTITSNSKNGIKISVYVDSIRHIAHGKTIDEAITKLREFNSPTKNESVLLDVEL